MSDFLILVPLIPLIASCVLIFWGTMLPRQGGSLSIFSAGISFIFSILILIQSLAGTIILPWEVSIPWFRFEFYSIEIGLYVDGLSLIMMVTISAISMLVQIYSLGYLKKDKRIKTYFAFVSLFTAAALGLCMAEDMIFLFICWEVMGICSYFLISHSFEEKPAAGAGLRAQIITLVGDAGLLVALLILFTSTGTFFISQISHHVESGYLSLQSMKIIALCIFFSAAVRAAQIPFQVWLIHAMEAPTCVSALLHGAVMTSAGIYLITRFFFLFSAVPDILTVIIWVGAASVLSGALLALTAIDIKKILAFSVVSELGLILCALGLGALSAGVFHLISVMLFNALLFLCAGSVIKGVHTRDIGGMGGLAKRMPVTAILFFIGIISLAGIWPTMGFFSKNEILNAITGSGNRYLVWIGRVSFLLTALYSFRLWFLIFVGDARNIKRFEGAEDPPHVMLIPMAVFAVLVMAAGWFMRHFHFIEWMLIEKIERFVSWQVTATGGALSIGGAIIAWGLYQNRILRLDLLIRKLKIVYLFFFNNFWLDKLFIYCVEKPFGICARLLDTIDGEIFDRQCVDHVGKSVVALGRIVNWIDKTIIDGLARMSGRITGEMGQLVRMIQTGFIQQYLFLSVLGLTLILFIVLY